MSGLYVKHVAVAALCSLLASVSLGSPVVGPEPIRCAPCTPDRLSQCPVVAPGCEELLREPGCGCCLACALKSGELCGIYTSPCGSGFKCTPRPGDPRPLHSLTRGQAVCTTIYLTKTPYDPRASADAQESMKAKLNSIRRKLVEQGPCHVDLQRALETIAISQQKLGDKMNRFYLPNCDKQGLFKTKQCESSLDGQRGRCWCVSSGNGKKILGSSDVPEDEECP
uniref:Insulin-like growth factor binding protein 1a n=1 Tax=Gadus morhua TaxID=8049 RepID=A0A8C4ZWL4_GADMO